MRAVVAEKPDDAVVKFDTYQNLQQHRAVLPAIALHQCILYYLASDNSNSSTSSSDDEDNNAPVPTVSDIQGRSLTLGIL